MLILKLAVTHTILLRQQYACTRVLAQPHLMNDRETCSDNVHNFAKAKPVPENGFGTTSPTAGGPINTIGKRTPEDPRDCWLDINVLYGMTVGRTTAESLDLHARAAREERASVSTVHAPRLANPNSCAYRKVNAST